MKKKTSITEGAVYCTVSCFFLVLFLSTVGLESTFCSAQEWNQWKGARRDNKSTCSDLNFEWGAQGPTLLWQVHGLGEGYSNISFSKDKIFTMGNLGESACLIALERSSGKRLWTCPTGPSSGVGYPGPRCTPASDGKLVWGMDQHSNLICCDAQTGKKVWQKNFVEDLDGQLQMYAGIESWGFAESPLLLGKYLYCTPGGDKGAVVALDKTTGDVVWRATDLKDRCAYASIVPAVIDKVAQLLCVTDKRLTGLDFRTGKTLWSVEYSGPGVMACDPVYEKGVLFITCAYRTGAFGYRIEKTESGFDVKEAYRLQRIDNKHHGVIVQNGYVYSSTERRQLICIDIQTGDIKWTKDRMNGGKTSLTYAEGRIIARGEDGTITVVEANPNEYREIASFMQPNRSNCNAWTYPVIVDGKMYLRDQDSLFCYKL